MDNTEIFWLSFREEETKEGKSVLVLTRKVGEGIAIGDDVKIVIMQIKGKQVRIGIQADPSTAVHREEIYQKHKLSIDLFLNNYEKRDGEQLFF